MNLMRFFRIAFFNGRKPLSVLICGIAFLSGTANRLPAASPEPAISPELTMTQELFPEGLSRTMDQDLRNALDRRDWEHVKKRLEDTDVNVGINSFGSGVILIQAVRDGNFEMTQWLLERGASPNVSTSADFLCRTGR